MGDLERRAFLYAAYTQKGFRVNWSTGEITAPPRRNDP